MALYAPDYTGTDSKGEGVSTRATIRRGAAGSFAHPERLYRSPYQVEYRITHCRQAGRLMYVDAETTLRCAIYKPRTTQVTHYYFRDSHVKDVWQEQAGTWMLKSGLIISQSDKWPQPRNHA